MPAAIASLEKSLPGSTIGFLAVDTETGNDVLSNDANRRLTPASNEKLFTTAAALETLGADFRFTTEVRLRERSGRMDLLIVGFGDPSIDGFSGACPDAFFSAIVEALRRSDVGEIDGDVICDSSAFLHDDYSPAWQLEDVRQPFGAPASAICFDDNSVRVFLWRSPGQKSAHIWSSWPAPVSADLQASDHSQIFYDRNFPVSPLVLTGWIETDKVEGRSIPIAQPETYWAERIREFLIKNGIRVSGSAREMAQPPIGSADADVVIPQPQDRLLFLWQSPPLREIVFETNKRSRNLWAELIFKRLGLEVMGEGSFEAGADAVTLFARHIGITENELGVVDGSGLARTNTVTCRAVVKLLLDIRKAPYAKDFMDSLPVSAVDGTLKGRFVGTPLEGRVSAKTGLLQGVNALSGYLHFSHDIAFSIIVNGRSASGPEAAAAIDAALVKLAAMIENQDEPKNCP